MTTPAWASRVNTTHYDDIVTVLLDSGADINTLFSVFIGQATPLSIACDKRHLSTVKLLIARGADVNQGGTKSPLVTACDRMLLKIVKVLLENGADVDESAKLRCHNAMMTAAAIPNSRALMKLLLEYGADINMECQWDNFIECPLSIADHYQLRSNVKCLLECGADLFREDGVTSCLHAGGLVDRDPKFAALVKRYEETNKRANRAMKPILK